MHDEPRRSKRLKTPQSVEQQQQQQQDGDTAGSDSDNHNRSSHAVDGHGSDDDAGQLPPFHLGGGIWDRLFIELRLMVLDHTGPLTKFLLGHHHQCSCQPAARRASSVNRHNIHKRLERLERLEQQRMPCRSAAAQAAHSEPAATLACLHTPRLDRAAQHAIWCDAFRMDWAGDLGLLPRMLPSAREGLLLVRSRSMYGRLCVRFPRLAETTTAKFWHQDSSNNQYGPPHFDSTNAACRLLHIPMRHGWFDAIEAALSGVGSSVVGSAGSGSAGTGSAGTGSAGTVGTGTPSSSRSRPRLKAPATASNGIAARAIALARLAIEFGHTATLRHLCSAPRRLVDLRQFRMLKHSERQNLVTDLAMDMAAEHGHLDVVRMLHEAGSTACSTRAIDMAATRGHLDVVRFLQHSRREGCTRAALAGAAANGHTSVVQFLLDCTVRLGVHGIGAGGEQGGDALAEISSHLQAAAQAASDNGHDETAALLVQVLSSLA